MTNAQMPNFPLTEVPANALAATELWDLFKRVRRIERDLQRASVAAQAGE